MTERRRISTGEKIACRRRLHIDSESSSSPPSYAADTHLDRHCAFLSFPDSIRGCTWSRNATHRMTGAREEELRGHPLQL